VYVSWNDVEGSSLAFARSTDGGRTFERATRIGGSVGFTPSQLAVGPDGTVHLVWTVALHTTPEARGTAAATSIFHARSSDGGATFGDPVAVSAHAGAERVSMISLAIAPGGALLAAVSETDGPKVVDGVQPRTQTRWTQTVDGRSWSPLASLSELAPDSAQGLPAVASTDDRWYILSYDADSSTTFVRLYSAPHGGTTFGPVRDLAARGFGAQDIYLHGGYELRGAADIAMVGDYVGLAAVGSQVAAAIVLPETDDWRSELTAYAGIVASA
jgi:hypothetical protein